MRLSSALNKDNLVCSGTTPTVTHLLKKVNQAIDAWSFRQVLLTHNFQCSVTVMEDPLMNK